MDKPDLLNYVLLHLSLLWMVLSFKCHPSDFNSNNISLNSVALSKSPKDKLIVMTGLSGSGKSSLAFDTIYAEGQRRYVESLSAYART
jgi:predicted GTPase